MLFSWRKKSNESVRIVKHYGHTKTQSHRVFSREGSFGCLFQTSFSAILALHSFAPFCALLRSFPPFRVFCAVLRTYVCALLRSVALLGSFALLCSFALFCAHLRLSASDCVLERLRLGISDVSDAKLMWT